MARKSESLRSAGRLITVSLDSLNLDANYQRPLKSHHKRIARNFDARAAQPLLVGERPDKSLWLIDGQQRRAALAINGISAWPARVIPSAGPEAEARVYAIINGGDRTVRQLSPMELFTAQVVSGDPVAIAALEAVRAGGLDLHRSVRKWPNLTCAKTVYQVAALMGPPVVRHVCEVISRSWPESDDALAGPIFHGLAILLARSGVDVERLVARLKATQPLTITQESRRYITGGNSRATAAYEAIALRYNKGLKAKRLPVRLAKAS
jgi:hypothetical protein